MAGVITLDGETRARSTDGTPPLKLIVVPSRCRETESVHIMLESRRRVRAAAARTPACSGNVHFCLN